VDTPSYDLRSVFMDACVTLTVVVLRLTCSSVATDLTKRKAVGAKQCMEERSSNLSASISVYCEVKCWSIQTYKS
jgi:hypothetical protein